MAFILVIDDDPNVRNVIRAHLEPAGHQVRDAGDGIKGLQAFIDERPDLVLCDLFMPEKCGTQTIRDMLRRDPCVPVIAISGGASWDHSSSRLYLSAAECLGTFAVLPKPFTAAALLAAVRDGLRIAASAGR
ncbi:MAG: response regulator [Gemmataceae bacterium]